MTPGVSVREAVPFPRVPDLLARSSVLVLPLADNRFGRVLTSPLKLFDYLATAVPLVLPDLPSITAALAAAGAGSAGVVRYRPDDPGALAEAILRARALPPRGPVVRAPGRRGPRRSCRWSFRFIRRAEGRARSEVCNGAPRAGDTLGLASGPTKGQAGRHCRRAVSCVVTSSGLTTEPRSDTSLHPRRGRSCLRCQPSGEIHARSVPSSLLPHRFRDFCVSGSGCAGGPWR